MQAFTFVQFRTLEFPFVYRFGEGTVRKHSTKLVKNGKNARQLGQMLKCKSTATTLRAILFAQNHDEIWRGLVATPAGCILETVLAEFKSKTPIALELVFMSTFTLLAQLMAEKGAVLRLRDGQIVKLDLFTVLLATTGQMKSMTVSKLLAAMSAIWQPRTIEDAGSTAGLMASMKENDGLATLWRLEEFGEFWAQTRTEAHSGTPRLILQAYDGSPITKRLKVERLIINSPYLSILGTTVTENIASQLSPADWKSGLFQRLCFVHCPPDPTRDWRDRRYALLDNLDLSGFQRELQRLLLNPIRSDYFIGQEAVTKIKDSWEMMATSGLSHDFVRRAEFRSFKYAVIYHWILGKSTAEIDAEDVNWGSRLAMLHLADLKFILDETEFIDYQELMRKGEIVRQKKGVNFSPRDLQMVMHRKLRNADEAKALYVLVIEAAARSRVSDLPSKERIQQLTGCMPDLPMLGEI